MTILHPFVVCSIVELLALQLLGDVAQGSPHGATSLNPEVVLALRQRVQRTQTVLPDPPTQTGSPYRGRALALASLHGEAARLLQLLQARRPLCNPEPEVARLEHDAGLLDRGELPHQVPGLHRLAYRSPLDGNLHPFVVYVPRSYPSGRRFPLVVMLHGMGSHPMRAVGRLFGTPEEDLREGQVHCDRPSVSGPEVLVVAPEGYGDALYRVVGELDVTAVVRTILAAYRVDRQRVTITGLSMGGTGAVEIALQRPDTYAGILALCGYYDRRLDSTIQGEPLLPWERHLMSVHSPVDWAENGDRLPLVLIHGATDSPGRARALESRYRELGHKVELELYPRGHDVWVPGYQAGRAFGILHRFHREASPQKLRFVTSRPRVDRAAWVTILRFTSHAAWAKVQAEVEAQRLLVKTENVTRLKLSPPATQLRSRARVEVEVDANRLAVERWAGSVELERDSGGWQIVDPAQLSTASTAGTKRKGLSGPIEDIYYDPLVVVYGTGAGQAAQLQSVAQRLAGYRKHVTLKYPILPDRRFSPIMARRTAAILVGNERSNSVLARLGSRLPLRILEGEVVAAGKRYQGQSIGATFIYPNPEAPDRYLRVVGGTTSRSYDLVEMLPIYLPDYVVFDEGIAAQRPLPILGSRRSLLAGGYFDESWRISAPPLSVRAKPLTINGGATSGTVRPTKEQ